MNGRDPQQHPLQSQPPPPQSPIQTDPSHDPKAPWSQWINQPRFDTTPAQDPSQNAPGSYMQLPYTHQENNDQLVPQLQHQQASPSPSLRQNTPERASLLGPSLYQPANYQARGPNGWLNPGEEMVLQPGSGLPVGRGSSPGSQTTQIPGVGTSQMQMMRGHLGNQFTEQGVHPVHQFPQPYGSQQMASAAFGQKQMRSATPRGEETASLTRYAQFQQGNAHPMEVDGNLKRIVLLGQTGVGKSSIGNILLGKRCFGESRGTDSCTDDTTAATGVWCTNGTPCIVIDTPGMDDSDNRDTEHIENIIEKLKEGTYVNTFVLVRNGQNKRMSNSFKSMLTIFELMFGREFWSHVVIDVSHVEYGTESDQEIRDWKRTIKKNFPKAKDAPLQTVILNIKCVGHPNFAAYAQMLWDLIANMEDFECKDFETTKTEMDQLRATQREMAESLAAFKADAENRMRQLTQQAEQEKADLERQLKSKHDEKKSLEQDLQNQKEEAQKQLNAEQARLAEIKESLLLQVHQLKEDKLREIQALKDAAIREKEEQEQRAKQEKEAVEAAHREQMMKVTADAQEGLTKITDAMHQLNNENSKVQRALIEDANKQVEDIILRNNSVTQKKVEEKIDVLGQNFDQRFGTLDRKVDDQWKAIDENKTKYETEINEMRLEGLKSEREFENTYPALKTTEGSDPAWKNLKGKPKTNSNGFTELEIQVREESPLQNQKGEPVARILIVPGRSNQKPTKTILTVGMTGSGKSTLIDALINYAYDVRYEDYIRLKLISLTSDEAKKQGNQATSQTDFITVYKIQWMPGMIIDFNVVLIDTPGLGDTRGIEHDKKMIKSIEVLFNSKEVTTLDTIGFVAKAGDSRLTAEQKYIFESILQIFGHDVKENLLSMLTFFDGNDLKVLDAFKEAEIEFVDNIPFNSKGIFQRKFGQQAVDRNLLTAHPEISFFQRFYDSSKQFFKTVQGMKQKSLQLTKEVLKDREHIEATVEGLSIQVRELLALKSRVDQEKSICEQHEADAKANENTEYEVTEDKIVKVDLEPGEFVTNCLECNRTCHYPCYIQNDEEKYNCAAMGRGSSQEETSCTVCPQNCHWQQHRNMSFRLEVESVTVTKTYEDIKARHQEFLDKHKGQITIVEALEQESQDISEEIQAKVDFITECLHRLSQNALRTSTTSSADYLDQMIQAEDHERKPGFERRIDQLRKEKAKAEQLANILGGKQIASGVQISARKVPTKAPEQSFLSKLRDKVFS